MEAINIYLIHRIEPAGDISTDSLLIFYLLRPDIDKAVERSRKAREARPDGAGLMNQFLVKRIMICQTANHIPTMRANEAGTGVEKFMSFRVIGWIKRSV